MKQTVSLDREENSLFRDFFELNGWGMFAFSCLVYALVFFIQQNFVLTEEVYYNTLGEQLTVERIDELLQTQKKWAWVSYSLIPLTVFVQVFLITLCLNTGTLLMDYKVKFRQLFGMVVKAVAIFAFGKVIITLVFLFAEVNTTEDLLRADWFSLSGWLAKSGIPDWLLYPLGVVNIFEGLFVLFLAAGMGWLLKANYKQMIGFVAGTYGLGLLIWVLFIVFLQLNLM